VRVTSAGANNQAAGTAASTLVKRRHASSALQLFRRISSLFPRNLRPNFTQYTSERPEMTFHDEKSKKAKIKKEIGN
jgi:hypothetical protein